MVLSQTLGGNKARLLKKPTGKTIVNRELKLHTDIKKAIDASLRGSKATTTKQRNLARQKAILKAMRRNRAFNSAIRDALTKAVTKAINPTP